MITIKNIKQRLAYINTIVECYSKEQELLNNLMTIYSDPKYKEVHELCETVDQSQWDAPIPKSNEVVISTDLLDSLVANQTKPLYTLVSAPPDKPKAHTIHHKDIPSTLEHKSIVKLYGMSTPDKPILIQMNKLLDYIKACGPCAIPTATLTRLTGAESPTMAYRALNNLLALECITITTDDATARGRIYAYVKGVPNEVL